MEDEAHSKGQGSNIIGRYTTTAVQGSSIGGIKDIVEFASGKGGVDKLTTGAIPSNMM
ncbi:hypothetical protein HPP92_019200 [Vanilla planifolia]|uniref:Uncharacterized protein n=1 Tax=Vanilla planifolia TaxID=51239 RepID=A0A835UP47_VANPL|nr:hypothetical protein HPP92_019200 [Vanilla planifolia]